MSTPEQEQALSTISALAASLRTQKLSDVQIDLLEVAAHLMSNIAVQTTLNCASTRLVEAEYQLGEAVMQTIPADRMMREHRQRTTVIDKQPVNDLGDFRYKTAHSGRGIWVTATMLSKLEK